MKKISLILAGLISFASADFLSFSAGAGLEKQEIDGYVKVKNTINYFNKSSAEVDGNPNTGNFGLDDKTNPFVWVKLIHPISILPNIKLEYTKYHSTGHSNYIAGNVEIFGDVTIPVALTNAYTKMDINSYDVTLFYEFNPVIADIEVGAGADIWDGKTTIKGNGAGIYKTWVDESFTVILPYVYGHLESMKIFGFSILADIKWAKAGDNHHYDYLGAVKYTINMSGPINPFIKVGYKYKDVFGVDGDNETKIKYKGAFAEIGVKF